jgi:predicted nucleic acid-binding protein
MKVVIDTNVLVSAALKDKGPEEVILSCAYDSGADFLITGDKDFSEAQKLTATTIVSVASFRRVFLNPQSEI